MQLATKFGIRRENGERGIDNRPEWIREACDASLRRLGMDHIDLYYMHRRTRRCRSRRASAPWASSWRGQGAAPRALRGEPGPLRAAHATHPIAALQSEWSLFTRDLEEEIVPTARELGVAIVPYSPLGRGELAGTLDIDAEDDFRRFLPRFQEGNREHNLGSRRASARSRGGGLHACPARARVAPPSGRGRGADPRHEARALLEENAAAVDVELTPEQLHELDEPCPRGGGGRPLPAGMATVER